MKRFYLFLFFLLATHTIHAQGISQTIKEGLILSYYIAVGNYDSIESYIKRHNYIFDANNKVENEKWYVKKISNENALILILFRENNKSKIGFLNVNTSGSFFAEKIEEEIKNHSNFDHYKDSAYNFLISKKKEDVSGHSENLEDIFHFVSVVQIDKEIIWFYPPLVFTSYYAWDLLISDLFE
ncbi:MAG: hypothetical protein ACK4ND_04745 [Cytophagaceae bacterium]